MKLIVEVRSVYGNTLAYPVCEKAKLFAQIAGSKTLTHQTLCLAERLGYVIEQAPHRALTGSTAHVVETRAYELGGLSCAH